MNKIPLFIDIDNTVSDHMDRLKRINESRLFPTEKYANDPDWVLTDNVLPGAKEAVNELSNLHEIIWLSARKKNLLNATKSWLIQNDFHIDKIILVNNLDEKIEILRKNQPSIFIDDLQYDFFSMKPKKATIVLGKLQEHKIPYIRYEGNWELVLEKVRELSIV